MFCHCGCGQPTKLWKGGYRRFVWGHNNGELPTPRIITSLADRLWAKVNKLGPIHPVLLTRCWVWTASLDGKGYGQINAGRMPVKMLRAHRVAYELLVGPVPEGKDLDHLCRRPACVNPEHLEPVPRRINLLRGETRTSRNAAVTHCTKGHPYSGTNLKRNRGGTRYCRECNRLRAAANRAAAKGVRI